ncbi:hypothetical protein QJS10_CPB19g01168 [Acorus calamus]|uniref:Jacalin-type lectin domain-containing protein n=1 Tax=Acorus calamus TaxID=4465 RepID=A0AAV9CIN8_ACOCL|nr:hypothetical protein QJS10_CPB19g01168 [Acorus calamus]
MSVKVERWGGGGGHEFNYNNATGIREITINTGDIVDSITFKYDHGGTSSWSSRQGGTGGLPHKIYFEYPDEFLTKIEGIHGSFWSLNNLIKSLTFHTNWGTKYGPYGTGEGTPFSSTTNGEIVGFFGNSGEYLDAIGIYTKQRN